MFVSDEEQRKNLEQMIETYIDMIAEKYELKVDWETTDLDNRFIQFQNEEEIDYEQAMEFFQKVENLLRKVYGENIEFF